MSSQREKIEEINRITDFWYSYVNMDHHKDCDCHWYIEQSWDYGDKPKWKAYHLGYVYDTEEIRTSTYDQALDALLSIARNAVRKEKSWAKGVLTTDGWDELQIEKAKKIQEFKL
jgi:hypothetical protein